MRIYEFTAAFLMAAAAPAAALSGAGSDVSTSALARTRVLAYEATYRRTMPNFARKYNMACTACHTTIPRLNQFGYEFRRAGYRLPEEIGTAQDVKFENTFAARIQPNFAYASHKVGGTTTTTEQLTFQEVTVYPLSASFGKYYGSLMELSVSPEDFFEIENAYFRYTRGDSTHSVSVRVGVFHPFEGYGASDRPYALSRPAFQTVAASQNGSTFFTPWGFDQSGLEVAYGRGPTTVSATVFNGIFVTNDEGSFKGFPNTGGNLVRASGFKDRNSKDVQVFVNHALRLNGSGVSGYFYSGTVDLPIPGTAPDAFDPTTSFTNRFYRLAVYASWLFTPHVGVQGGYQMGRDHFYNTTTASASETFNSNGYFAEVFAPVSRNFTPGLRYDAFRPSTDVSGNDRTAITAYANVPFVDGLQFIGEVKHVRQERPGLSAVTDNSFNLRLIWIW